MKIKLTLLFMLLCIIAKAQTVSPDNRIVVIGHATIDVPADQVKFVVILTSIDSASIDKVYQKHQQQEDKLVKLLKELQISAKDINYSLLTVNQRQDYNTRKRATYFAGHQTVGFVLNDVDVTNFGYGNKYGYAYDVETPGFMERFRGRFKQ